MCACGAGWAGAAGGAACHTHTLACTYVENKHWVQEAALLSPMALETVPGGQGVQADAAGPLAYRPTGQTEQPAAPGAVAN